MNGLLIFRASNPDVLKFMKSHNITGDFKKLEEIYIQRIVEIASNLSANSVVWQEVFDNGVVMPKDTVVHVWKGDMEQELAKVRRKYTVNYS
jgi:hexosaminidase